MGSQGAAPRSNCFSWLNLDLESLFAQNTPQECWKQGVLKHSWTLGWLQSTVLGQPLGLRSPLLGSSFLPRYGGSVYRVQCEMLLQGPVPGLSLGILSLTASTLWHGPLSHSL